MIALYIIAVIIAVILLLLSFKLRAIITYSGKKADIKIKYMFFSIPIDLDKKKKKQKKSPKPKKTEKPKKDFFETVSELLELVSAAGAFFKAFLSLCKLELTLDASISKNDAAKTAIETGKTSAYVHSALGFLANFLEIKRRDVSIRPDYESEESKYELYAVIYARPINVLFKANKFLSELLRLADALPEKSKKEKELKK